MLGRFEVKSRFGKCQVGVDIASDIPSETVAMSIPHFHDNYIVIEVKIKSITQQEDDTFIIEFASEEDAKLYQDNYEVSLIRMIFIE